MEYFAGKPRNASFETSVLMDVKYDSLFISRENEDSIKNPFFRLNLNDSYLITGLLVIGGRKG